MIDQCVLIQFSICNIIRSSFCRIVLLLILQQIVTGPSTSVTQVTQNHFSRINAAPHHHHHHHHTTQPLNHHPIHLHPNPVLRGCIADFRQNVELCALLVFFHIPFLFDMWKFAASASGWPPQTPTRNWKRHPFQHLTPLSVTCVCKTPFFF